MPACIVKHCKNNSKKVYPDSNKITFHRLPKDSKIRQKWIEIIRESRNEDDWNGSDYCIVCSEHFKKKDRYITKRGIYLINKNALPTENLVNPDAKIDVEDAPLDIPAEKENSLSNSDSNLTLDSSIVPFISDSIDELPFTEDDVQALISHCELGLLDPPYETESPVSFSEIDLSIPDGKVQELDSHLQTPDPIWDLEEAVPLWHEEEEPVPLCDIEPSILDLDVVPSVAHSEIELPQPRCEMEDTFMQPNYQLVLPPSQDPDVQYIEKCIKREKIKYREYRRMAMRKLNLLQQKEQRLKKNNACLELKLAQLRKGRYNR